jgi:hypothetical protein
MPFTVTRNADKMLLAISPELDPGSYWAEVQLGIVEHGVNLGLRDPKGLLPDEEKSHDALANSDRCNAGILDFTHERHGGAKR